MDSGKKLFCIGYIIQYILIKSNIFNYNYIPKLFLLFHLEMIKSNGLKFPFSWVFLSISPEISTVYTSDISVHKKIHAFHIFIVSCTFCQNKTVLFFFYVLCPTFSLLYFSNISFPPILCTSLMYLFVQSVPSPFCYRYDE